MAEPRVLGTPDVQMFITNSWPICTLLRLLAAAFVGVVIPTVSHAASPPAAPFFSLAGEHKFAVGDDFSWADPSFDDSNWRTLRVPGEWTRQGIPAEPIVGWYRIKFTAPPSLSELKPALQIGPAGLAYEVYLNGALIGQVGRIDSYHLWGEKWREQLFDLPPDQLRIGEQNCLAIRVQQLVGGGGIMGGPFGIGDAAQMRRARLRASLPVLAVEAGFIAFYASTLLLSGMLWLLGMRARSHVWFAVVILQIGLSHVLESYLAATLWGESYGTVVCAMILQQLFPLATLFFYKHTLQQRVGPLATLLVGTYCALCVLWWLNLQTKHWLYIPIYFVSVVTFGPLGIVWCVQAVRRRHPDAWPLLLGTVTVSLIMASLLLPGVHTANTPWGGEPRVLGAPVNWYGWLSLHVCMIYILASGYVRSQNRLRQTSQGILEAQEEERRRLARELHDGVGQSMLALKLRIDLLHLQAADADGGLTVTDNSLGDEAADVAQELLRVAGDLHPVVLEESGLVAAVRRLAADLHLRMGVEMVVRAEGTSEGLYQRDGHLYRIIQEAVNNAIRHGGATRIEVQLIEKDDHRVLDVQDNGCGFEMTPTLRDPTGLGLSSMRERAKLLGGSLSVFSRPGNGTRVTVKCPRGFESEVSAASSQLSRA